jgi:ATP-dependent DNA helicase PIF1
VAEFALSAEQAAVFELIENTRENIFVTGRAGTGKSTLLNHLSWNTAKQVVIAAPTGVAALNVGGQTIHSLFRLPIGVIADHAIDQVPELRKLLNTIDTLVIDEVSMVNADLVDAIDRSLRQARQKPFTAFGGVQVVLFGDPYQLAPVPGDADERAYFTDQYRSMWFFDAKVWQETELRIFELTTIHRQHEAEFKFMLNAVAPQRHGRPARADGWHDHPRHPQRHRQPHQCCGPRPAPRGRQDGEGRCLGRVRRAVIPCRRVPAAQGGCASDVPAQRFRR